MEPNSMFKTVFECVLKSSWQAAVLVCLVLVVQTVLGRKLSPRWRYSLWFLVLIRLLVPVTPQSALSIYNLAPDRATYPLGAERGELALFVDNSLPAAEAPQPREPIQPQKIGVSQPPPGKARSRTAWATLGWLAGAWVVSAYFAWGIVRFGRRVRRLARLEDVRVESLLEEAKRRVGIMSAVEVVETCETSVPAMYGLLRPRLLLPRDFRRHFSDEELRLVFLHELTHLQRRDHVVNWVMLILSAIHWFNPLVWLAFGRMRADRELACDEQVLAISGEDRNQDYGRMLIKLLEGLPRPARLPGLVGIVENTNQLKRRITMIAKFKRPARWSAWLALPVIVLGLITLTDAQTKKERADKDIIAEIEKLGGKVTFDETRPSRPVIGISFYDEDYWKEPTSSVTDETLKSLGTLTELEELDLTNAQITDAGLVHLRGLAKLRKVSFLMTKINGAGLNNLKAARKLTELNLWATKVTDTALANLSEFPDLEVVSLNATKTTDTGLAHLKGLSNLKDLQLYNNKQITDAGLESLKHLPKLQKLQLSRIKQMTDAGLKHLQNLVNLEELNLRGTTGIGDAGLSFLSLLPKLRKLDLFATSVTDAGLANANGFPKLAYLRLERSKVTDAGLVHLKKFPKLEKLYLGEPRQVNDAALKHLKGLPNLKVLGLTNGDITEAGLIALNELPPLEITSYSAAVPFRLSGPSITDSSLVRLKHLAKLTALSLQDTRVSGSGLAHLKSVPGLAGLDLTRTQITDADLFHLRELLDLEVLNLFETQISDAGLAHLKESSKLMNLNLSGTRVTDAGLAHLRDWPKLTFLHLSRTKITDDGLAHLAGLVSLYTLSLDGTEITDSGLPHLKPLLNLRFIELKDAKVSSAGIEALKKDLPNLQVSQ